VGGRRAATRGEVCAVGRGDPSRRRGRQKFRAGERERRMMRQDIDNKKNPRTWFLLVALNLHEGKDGPSGTAEQMNPLNSSYKTDFRASA
jgi:hypothetical protein